jgi:hypothetical protein
MFDFDPHLNVHGQSFILKDADNDENFSFKRDISSIPNSSQAAKQLLSKRSASQQNTPRYSHSQPPPTNTPQFASHYPAPTATLTDPNPTFLTPSSLRPLTPPATLLKLSLRATLPTLEVRCVHASLAARTAIGLAATPKSFKLAVPVDERFEQIYAAHDNGRVDRVVDSCSQC